MFARISNRYDLLNTVMTAGRHLVWKKCVAELAATEMEGPALDVATGTGDIAISLSKISAFSKIIGLDFTREMLEIAKRKSQQPNLTERLNYIVGDAHALPFSNNQFVSATVGFGIRNFTDIPKALTEISRVLKPGGRIFVLEIVRQDKHGPMSQLFPIYFRYVTPLLGALFAGDLEAYTYLPKSVEKFLGAGELAEIIEGIGLRNISIKSLALGTVVIISGEKSTQ